MLLQSLDLLVESVSDDVRKQYLKGRHQHIKVSSSLEKYGKFEKGAAKNLSYRIAACAALSTEKVTVEGDEVPVCSSFAATEGQPAAGQFDWTTMSMWITPPKPFKDMLDDIQEQLNGVVTKADEKMKANDKWAGAQLKVAFKPGKEYDSGMTLWPGLGPHVVTVCRDVPRVGPAAFPLPTVGCFVSPLSEALFFVLLDAKMVLEKGISLANLYTFLGTESGAEFLKSEQARFVYLPEKSVMYVPWEWFVIPVYYNSRNRDKPVAKWATVLHVPAMVGAEACSISTLRAAKDIIRPHMIPFTATMWKERLAAMEEFWKGKGL